MKLSRGDKPFIDYAKMDLQDATKQLLFCFSQEELDCRDYYRMEAALDICDEPERQRRLQGLRRVMAHNFGQQTEEPYVMAESDSDRRRSIKVLKRSRYFPPVQYRHDHFEFFSVLSGSCTHVCKGQTYTLQQGDFCLLEYGVPHKLYNYSDSCIVLELIVRKQLLDRICNVLLQESTILSHFFQNALYGDSNYPMIVFHTGSNRAVPNYIYAMYRQYHMGSQCSHILLEALLNALFVILMRNFQPQQEQPGSMDGTPVGAIMRYVHEHEKDVTLQTLAEEFGYSVPYLSKLIRTSTGRTFTGILRQIRMRRASWLLKNTSLTSTQIAAEVHCVDTSHFARTFRKEFQMSPQEYRELFSIRQMR